MIKIIGERYLSYHMPIRELGQNAEIWLKYRLADVQEHEQGLYLAVEVAPRILYAENCWDRMTSLYKSHGGDCSSFRSDVFKALVGKKVQTSYDNQTYTIKDIKWDCHLERSADPHLES
jgi:hypothetical protein